MLNWFHSAKSNILGRNTKSTPTEVIVDQLNEPRPLPIGRQDFEEWSDRIISGAMLPAVKESQKYVLADMLLHLGPTEDHKPDNYFIHCLRKFAVNQVAIAMRKELYDQEKARMATEEVKPEEVKEAAQEIISCFGESQLCRDLLLGKEMSQPQVPIP